MDNDRLLSTIEIELKELFNGLLLCTTCDTSFFSFAMNQRANFARKLGRKKIKGTVHLYMCRLSNKVYIHRSSCEFSPSLHPELVP